MFRTLVSGGQAASDYKDSIWSFNALTDVWITTNLILGSPNYAHAIAPVDSCPGGQNIHFNLLFQIISDNII